MKPARWMEILLLLRRPEDGGIGQGSFHGNEAATKWTITPMRGRKVKAILQFLGGLTVWVRQQDVHGSNTVVSCLGSFHTIDVDGATVHNLVLDYVNGSSLADRSIGRLTEHEVQRLARSIARGLAYVHSKGYVHYDVKPGEYLGVSVRHRRRRC